MRTATAFALAAVLATAGTGAAQDVTLKWNLKEGTTFYAKTLADMDIEMSVAGQDIKMPMKVTQVQRFKVLSASGSATKVEMTMQDMSMEMGGPLAGAAGGAVAGLGEKVKGATITATLNDKMEVTKVEGADKFLDKLAPDDMTRAMMKGMFSEAAVGQMFTQVFVFAPEKPVKPGESWTRTDKMPTGGFGEGAVKQKYTLKSVTGGVAAIDLTGDVTFKAGDGAIPGLPPGVKVSKFDMKADKFGGSLNFDTAAGRLKDAKQTMNMSGTMAISANGMGLEMAMKMKVTQTTTITDKNPVKD